MAQFNRYLELSIARERRLRRERIEDTFLAVQGSGDALKKRLTDLGT